jgi:hypothetical protein
MGSTWKKNALKKVSAVAVAQRRKAWLRLAPRIQDIVPPRIEYLPLANVDQSAAEIVELGAIGEEIVKRVLF